MVDFVGADYAFGDLLRAIAGNDSGAVVFHCTAARTAPAGARPSC
jgi:protein-tyrosine phosphatase